MILLAILTGIVTALTIRYTTNASRLRATTRKIYADLLEFRLYFDEPRLIWQAQMNLVRDNLRLFLLFLPAMLILGLPMAWLILQLDVLCGLRPLHPGEATVFTAQLKRPLNATDRIDLQGRTGVKVETPPVRVARDNQVAWRIRPSSNGRAALDLTVNGRTVRKSIMTGDSTMLLSPRRSSNLTEFLLHPEEPRMPEEDVAWLAVDYPKNEAAIPWLVWFLVISTASAWILARRLRFPPL
jgi:hypothetical protein